MLKAMTISSINMDPVTNSPIIILEEIEGKQTLPIWIGLLEATAIASEIEGVRFSRPMTHDLLKNIMDKTDIKINRIEICDLKDNTYYALIHMTMKNETLSIDSRPSDAIAIALRTKAPIFVSDEVLKKSKQIEATKEGVATDKSEQGKKWQDILEKLNPEDFGKYKMEALYHMGIIPYNPIASAPGIIKGERSIYTIASCTLRSYRSASQDNLFKNLIYDRSPCPFHIQ